MEEMKTLLGDLLKGDSANTPRSLQANVGPSEIGGCTAKLWYRLKGFEATNETLVLASWMGTAIHEKLAELFADVDGYEVEVELEADGVMGHVDLIDIECREIVDWKTTTKANLAYFPSEQYIQQVHLYGYLASKNGYDIQSVRLVGICRDGNENDIVEWSAPYDEAIALKSIERLREVEGMEFVPAPEKDVKFCRSYCQFYGLCPGLAPKAGELIMDADIDAAAIRYLQAEVEVKKWTGVKDELKEVLAGSNGTTLSGYVIKSTEVAGRSSVDEAAVEAALGYVPKVQGKGYSRLTVKEG